MNRCVSDCVSDEHDTEYKYSFSMMLLTFYQYIASHNQPIMQLMSSPYHQNLYYGCGNGCGVHLQHLAQQLLEPLMHPRTVVCVVLHII